MASMTISDMHESNSDSSMSLSSSILVEDRSSSIFDYYGQVMDMDDYQHSSPPAIDMSTSMVLERTAAIRTSPSEADDFSMSGWTTVGTSSAASETTCPAPASVSVSVSASVADLTASELLRLELQDTRPSGSLASPGSHVVRDRACEMSVGSDSLFSYSYTFVQDDQGLCGIGAWADITTSSFVAKKRRITPRQ
ncbi:uncharacterized protein FFB20_06198 [Fusarium fujikuroi]|uniref:Uncharacterized protein n=2 Tax=Fusarium fujikuroi TaxID=5127 RepID=S0DJD8_GIBF5|nr:uncharacterized protein FFUJ_01038 [Fusarium fujikuroi IMI 58289]KLP18996.1 uncharacterized protein LW94_8832 [Fusarium fujikuroi]QGI58875.1 hypothetical protein CEK27_001000 [Fusarium fujikuroi]QGI76090.1 hypothetical protein CEK25_000996 [Fusarium fujikuroi]QGI89785.1 hypothetical protein CEK26_001000 [Fusarium fujikuroi]CCT62415.1 uncharacterized protein FFUJ_01038 [Fusarium fujikuroi IMI 58289]